MEIYEENCKSFRNGRKVMKSQIIILHFQLKKQKKKINQSFHVRKVVESEGEKIEQRNKNNNNNKNRIKRKVKIKRD